MQVARRDLDLPSHCALGPQTQSSRWAKLMSTFFDSAYAPGALLPMHAAQLASLRTQTPYAPGSLASCRPHTLETASLNLGELLYGEVVQSAPFALRVGQSGLRALCKLQLDGADRELWARRIRDEYRAHLRLDNLPVATRVGGGDCGSTPGRSGCDRAVYERGYPLGYVEGTGRRARAFLHNHLEFTVRVHTDGGGGRCSTWRPVCAPLARIVGFEVVPSSRRWRHARAWPGDYEGPDGQPREVLNLPEEAVGLERGPGPLPLHGGGRTQQPMDVIFTYNVTWALSDVPYSSRWDVYLNLAEGTSVHWFSLSTSLVLSLLLAAVVALIMVRTVRRDLQRCGSRSNNPRHRCGIVAMHRARLPWRGA